uniref:(northern house mosquito) hypothetical protein n=1 Tax=Culex pipiens TaxID=7175 RepID=A0A8D8CF27_CULPI
MDSQTCPVEILEQIFNNLFKLDDLLNCALVCRRWNVAAERLIVQRSQVPIFAGQSPCALADVTRNYRAVRIYYRDDRWDELRSLLDVCREKFHLRAVVIYGILADHLNRLYVAYRQWLETVEEMVIFMDDRICQKLDGGPEGFTLQLPNLKRLRWSEYLYQTGEKIVIIDAPNLRKLTLKNSLDSTTGLVFLDCSSLQELKGTFYTRQLSDVFEGAFPELKTLYLDSSLIAEDVELLHRMPQLAKLVLHINFPEDSADRLSTELCSVIADCRMLEHLQLTSRTSTPCKINLTNLIKPLVNLQHLNLEKVTVADESTTWVCPSLKSMTLENFTFLDNTAQIQLEAPMLDSLSISAANLSQLFTANESHLRELNVDQDTLSLREAFETHLVPFLDRSGHNVRKLILAKLTYFETDPYDCFTSCKPLHVETLCFHSTGCSLDCLEQLAGWSNLEELSIINCCIGTGGVHKTVTLANLKRLHIVNCTLSDESCTEFPIIGPNSETIRGQEEEDGALHFRNCWNH